MGDLCLLQGQSNWLKARAFQWQRKKVPLGNYPGMMAALRLPQAHVVRVAVERPQGKQGRNRL